MTFNVDLAHSQDPDPQRPERPAADSHGFDLFPHPLVLLDAGGRVRDANAAFCALTGLNKEAVLGRRLEHLCDFSPAVPEPSPGMPVPAHGQTPPSRLRLRRPDGTETVWWLSVVPLPDGSRLVRFLSEPVGSTATVPETEARFQTILQSIGDAVLTTDAHGRVDFMNAVAERLTGWSAEEAHGRPIEEVFRIVHEETGQPVESPVTRVLREGVVVGLANHTVLRSRDGREIPISDAGAPIRDAAGRVLGVVLVFRDQTAERSWQRHREAERQLLEQHAAALPLEEWLTRLCLAYERLHPGALCSVLRLDRRRLYTAAAPSLPAAYSSAIDGVQIGPCVGSCGTAAHRNEPVIVENIATSPLWAGYQELAATHQLAACWSFPIRDSRGRVLGTFAVYYRQPRGPTEEEFRTLERWAHLASLVMEHHQTLDALRQSEARLAAAQARARLGSWELDLIEGRAEWSAEMARLHSYDPDKPAPSFEEFLELVHPDDQARLRAVHQRITQARAPFLIEYRTHPDRGPVRTIQARVEVLRDETGRAVRIAGTSLDITELKRLEESVRRSEEQFRRLIQFAPEAIVLLDVAAGRFVMANPAAERLFGMPARELLRHGPVELSPPVQPDGQPSDRKAHQFIAAALAGETPAFEWVHRNAEGRDIPCEVRLLRLEFDGRTVIRGSILDISERKAAEERIARLTRTYALLSEINQLIVRERDPAVLFQGTCRIAVETGGLALAWLGRRVPETGQWQELARAATHPDAPELCRILGSGSNQCCAFVERAWTTLAPAICSDLQTAPEMAPCREEVLRFGLRSVGCFPVVTAGGIVAVLALFADQPGFFDADMQRLFQELTADLALALENLERERQRQEAVAQLRQSEERFRKLIENATDLIAVVDARGTIHYGSPSVTRLLGYDPVALVGQSALQFVHPEDLPAVREALERAVTRKDGLPVAVSFRIRHQSGTWHHLEAVGRFVSDLAPGGGIVVNARDVTELRQLEEQLRQAQKLEAIGRLAGGVAHDFNNVLAVILMQTELLSMEETLPADVRDGLHQIRSAAERAATLTRQLLMFSRKQIMQTRELDLNELLTSLVKMVQRIIGEDIQLQLRLHPRPLIVRADPGMLDQVVMNLVVNARDAMPQGGVLILETDLVRLEPGHPEAPADLVPGPYALLRVSDTGVGIPAEHLERIFEPFFTTKEPGKGTGLGLSTVFGVAKQHRGTVTVRSVVGEGSTFEVWLPLHSTEAAAGEAQTRTRPPGGTETILLVEDDESVRTLMRAILESAGYRVLAACDAAEAMEIWRAQSPEIRLLLTDVVMPGGINGHELAARLRRDNPGLRVLFTSGYSAEMAGRELNLAAGQTFVPKPANPHELLEAVRRCLDAR
ncbi:PAS domain S-box protein [Limisphaera sp. VF-2]|jgi:PAS domain S-box-containing protein|uniref:PAS domain S-box protein n=1 Tax=Limisphaera sp. VF-2 TaxID=3400418 RepID=UPI0017734F26|nr:PAS domain S-box protein [Limisphaera sp.]